MDREGGVLQAKGTGTAKGGEGGWGGRWSVSTVATGYNLQRPRSDDVEMQVPLEEVTAYSSRGQWARWGRNRFGQEAEVEREDAQPRALTGFQRKGRQGRRNS